MVPRLAFPDMDKLCFGMDERRSQIARDGRNPKMTFVLGKPKNLASLIDSP